MRKNPYKGVLKALSVSRKMIVNPRQRQESQPSEVLGGAVFKEVELKICLFLHFLIIV